MGFDSAQASDATVNATSLWLHYDKHHSCVLSLTVYIKKKYGEIVENLFLDKTLGHILVCLWAWTVLASAVCQPHPLEVLASS